MAKNIKDVLGASQEQDYQFDGSNKIDLFPIFVFDPTKINTPSESNLTVQGVVFRSWQWNLNDYVTMQTEINHMFKTYGYVDFHVRLFPTDNTAGNFKFEIEYFIMHADGTTTAGGTAYIEGSIGVDDLTNNIGQYEEVVFTTPTTFVDGDIIIGNVKRISTTGDYGNAVAIIEWGAHIGVGKTGTNFD